MGGLDLVDEGSGATPKWPANVSRRLAVAALGVATYAIAGVSERFSAVVESAYAFAAPPIVWLLSRITGVVPFSITELIYVGYATWLLSLAWKGIAGVLRKRHSVSYVFVGGATRLARDAGLVVFLFYLMWGFNYSRPSLEQRLGWPAWSPGDVEELANLSAELVDQGNTAYVAIHGRDDAGTPTVLPDGLGAVHAAIESAFNQVATDLDLRSSIRWRYGKPKYLASSAIYARLGITGFYFPFTAEANVRWGLPALSLPQSVAHEKAHQRGIASEDEASFVGFVAGMLSEDPYVRYSSVVFAQRQLVAALARADRDRFREIAAKRLPGVQRDIDDLTQYFRRFIGVGTTVGRSVNDRFLRANRVAGGVLSYGRVARLLITFSRETQGTLVPTRP